MRNDVRERLIGVAKRRGTITYGELMEEFGIPRGHHKRGIGIGDVLDNINRKENAEGRPMITVITVHKSDRMPGKGFFKLARELGHLINQNDRKFWIDEINKVWEYWSKH